MWRNKLPKAAASLVLMQAVLVRDAEPSRPLNGAGVIETAASIRLWLITVGAVTGCKLARLHRIPTRRDQPSARDVTVTPTGGGKIGGRRGFRFLNAA